MPKTRAFEISPLATEALASLKTLGLKIAASRKSRGISQKEMAVRVGISPQTMLFIEQGRPNVQIGHYARALAELGSGVLSSKLTNPATQPTLAPSNKRIDSSSAIRANALRRHLMEQPSQSAPTQKLEFAYNWSNPAMSDDTLIRSVVAKGRFHDLAVICKRFGLDRVRQITGETIAASPSLRRSFANIEQGFKHERPHSA